MDDYGTPIEGRARLHRPYFRIALVVGLATAVIGLGYFGPHPTPPSVASPPASPVAQNPSVAPSEPVTTGLDALTELTQVQPIPSQIRQSWLPLQITSRSMAVIGLRLFYVVRADRIESSVVGSTDDPQTLVQVSGCDAINQLAGAGHELGYVVTSPAGSTSQAGGCGDTSTVAWSVWLLDLNGGSPQQVARGTRESSSISVDEFPVHLALTASAYAFDRPPVSEAAGSDETVEVHAIDGELLWTSETAALVSHVMLGGNRLALLTERSPLGEGLLDLWTSDAGHPRSTWVAQPASSASLSPDGSYLTWDLPPAAGSPTSTRQSGVGILSLDSGGVEFLAAPTGSETPAPLNPTISSTESGPVMAWFATAPGGSVYPAFRFPAGASGAVLSSVQAPVWMDIEGGTLIWVAESYDGWSAVAFAVDLGAVNNSWPASERPAS